MLQVFECDGVPRLAYDESDAVLWIDRPDEEMPSLRDFHVFAKPARPARADRRSKCGRRARQSSSRAVGLHRRPLASQAHDLCGERPEGVPVEDRSRNQGLVGAIHLDDVRTSGRDPDEEPHDARARDDACRPLVLEASANLVEPNDPAKAVEHRIERGSLVAQDGEVEAL